MLKEAAPLLAMTFAFIIGFAMLFGNTELQSIRANWNERRCDPFVMLMAHLVPDGKDPNVDRAAFAAENFSFCTQQFIDSSLNLFLQPFLALFGKQVDASEVIASSVNSLRVAAASLMAPLQDVVNLIMNKTNAILYQIFRVFFHFENLFKRIFAVTTISAYMGTMMMEVINRIARMMFTVAIIICLIIAAICVLLPFGLAAVFLGPLYPMLFIVLGILTAAGFGGAIGGVASDLCVAPGTLVAMAGNQWKPVEEIQPGDALEEGFVEGILEAKCAGTCIVLKGVVLSESHLVYDDKRNKWCLAGEMEDAKPLARENQPERLYCLNTSTRTWRVKSPSNTAGEAKVEGPFVPAEQSLLLRDWEELPANEEEDHIWEENVYEQLNHAAIVGFGYPFSHPGRGLVGPETKVWEITRGAICVKEVRVGDFILGGHGEYVEVFAVYRDTAELQPLSGVNASAWIWYAGKGVWRHLDRERLQPACQREGWQCIVEGGIFTVEQNGMPLLVRDFTEIGLDKISQTYPFTLSRLNIRNAEADNFPNQCPFTPDSRQCVNDELRVPGFQADRRGLCEFCGEAVCQERGLR